MSSPPAPPAPLPLHFAVRTSPSDESSRSTEPCRTRRRAMSTPAKHQIVAGPPASQPVFPDEILEEIFVRLDAAEDLARASAACTTFRRVVSARRFLHRFRGLHPPPVLGVLDSEAFRPAEPPHRSALAARALAQAADFTFSSLGTPRRWFVCDARDGRVLLFRSNATNVFADLMVCDPLHRRHVQLPPIPNDLAATTTGCRYQQDFDPFLDHDTDKDKDKEKQDLSFRVICAVHYKRKLVTFHFSSVTGQWRGITFKRRVPLRSSLAESQDLYERHYAHGCYFWTIADGGTFMFMLNMHDMKVSVVDLPPGVDDLPQTRAIVEAGEGVIGLFALSDGMVHLYYKSLQGTEWQHQRIIPLPKPNSDWSIVHAAAGYLLLKSSALDASQFAKPASQYFTLNLKTFLVEELCFSNNRYTSCEL